jgi:hypothetical protein
MTTGLALRAPVVYADTACLFERSVLRVCCCRVTSAPVLWRCCVVWPTVRAMTQSEGGRRIPTDSFRIRLAIVRTEMGWNYDQAEAATGIISESWRLWEKGQRHCSDVIGVSRRIAEVTPFDQTWIALGGPLAAEKAEPPRPRKSKAVASASTSRVSPQSFRGCVSATRPVRFEGNIVAELATAA